MAFARTLLLKFGNTVRSKSHLLNSARVIGSPHFERNDHRHEDEKSNTRGQPFWKAIGLATGASLGFAFCSDDPSSSDQRSGPILTSCLKVVILNSVYAYYQSKVYKD